MIKAIIFSLDSILVNTSAIENFRENRQWREVKSNLNKCSVYSDILDLLNSARLAGLKVSVLTNYPKQHAEDVIRHFNIYVDYVVAYNDARSQKLTLDSILNISEKVEVEVKDIAFLSNSSIDFESAKNAGVQYYSIEGEDLDRSLKSFNYLMEQVEKSAKKKHSNRSELVIEGNKLFLGYYLDEIKTELLSFKNANDKSIKRWTAKALDIVDSFPEIDFIVRALGHAELNAENTDKPLDRIAKKLSVILGAKYEPSILQKKNVLKKSTSISGSERASQVKGVYTLNKKIKVDNNVIPKFLIIDDVYTSGATTGDITRAIIDSYPNAQVYIFTLVKTLYRSQIDANSFELQHNNMLFDDLNNSRDTQLSIRGTTKQPYSVKSVRKLTTKKITANYANTNHNFVIQNLPNSSILSSPLNQRAFSIIQVAKNIIQRGNPTIANKRLRELFGLSFDKTGLELEPLPLISCNPLFWNRLIRGHTASNSYPAKIFFEELLEKYLGEYGFIKQLTVPEVQIFDITQTYVEQFHNKQVDFFIPHIGVIIEIDGPQHLQDHDNDLQRDNFTKKFGVQTFRFTTEEVSLKNYQFKDKMSSLYSYIKKIDNLEQQEKINPPNGLTLDNYREFYINGDDFSDDIRLKLTASCRFQLTILELMERGVIDLKKPSTLTVINHDKINFIENAIIDLTEMLDKLSELSGINNMKINLNVKEVQTMPSKVDGKEIILDFSILQRFNDQHQTNLNIIYSRTDYFDFYRDICGTDAQSIEQIKLELYDYFTLSCTSAIEYNLDLSPNSRQRESLRYFLSNIFLPKVQTVDFREGQIGIIGTALSKKSTIGLLPTGSGKSICYQLAALLQPGISFVVCPIKSLMYDQKMDLDLIGFTRSNYITSELTASEKARVQKDFGIGKYFFVYISPERFQTPGFREEMRAIGMDLSFSYAVIDEAHCLSEWGHDFRTSYLNLANTINNFAPNASYIGLTATASINVLKDIQTEFGIHDDFVRTPINFSREELSFHVINDSGQKFDKAIEIIGEMERKWNIERQGNKAGIIFTSTVNGNKGCYELSNNLSKQLNMDVRFYSGSAPKNSKNSNFDQYKHQVQDDFKCNRYNLLAATKAFGMGVNKGNVAYTIHYGIPSSMEALYQEAGRAGRDKDQFVDMPADCYVLLTPEKNTSVLEKIWDQTITIPELKNSVKSLSRSSDLNTNMYLMTASMDTIEDEGNLIYEIYTFLQSRLPLSEIQLTKSDFNVEKSKLEKAIYRLTQLQVIKDWVIEDFFNGVFKIYLNTFNLDTIEISLEKNIHKYESDFCLDNVFSSSNLNYKLACKAYEEGRFVREKFIIIVLLIWTYEHFVYNRRQSQKNVYEQCLEVTEKGVSAEAHFKARLEGYFKHDKSSQRLLHIAENSVNTSDWLSIFYDEDNENNKSRLLADDKLNSLAAQISRFLESYKENTTLDYLSGVSRLISNKFDDSDGKLRMSLAFDNIIKDDYRGSIVLVNDTLKLGSVLFTHDAMCDYAELVHEKFKSQEILLNVNKAFNDAYSQRILLIPLKQRLEKLTEKYEGIEW